MSLSITPAHSIPTYPSRNQSSSARELRRVFCISSPISDPKDLLCTSLSTKNSNWKRCEYVDLHNELVPYRKGWDLQKAILKEKKGLIERNEECRDTLIVLQHHPVYTLGTGGSEEFLNFDISSAPFDIVRTERGGQVTYHGPGQLVMYPIINLRNHRMDLHWYLRALEEVAIRVLSTFAIKASRAEGLTGVWVGDQKLAAIGIRVSQWITCHGLALNVSTDLSPFNQIVPCGIQDRSVGSIKGVLGQNQAKGEPVAENFVQADDFTLISITHESLLREFSEVFRLKLEPRCLQMIVKSGDDCRQEHLALQLISHFYDIFQEAGLPLWLRPYEVLVTSSYTALIETIPDTASIHSIKSRYPNISSLREFFNAKYQENSPTFKLAQRNFVESMAGYSLVCYLLQVKDRHNGNLLLDEDGHIIHIDFGFMLSNSPGGVNFESAPFKLTRELLEVMDSDAEGVPSEFFDYFKVLLIQGFPTCRKHAERIILLVEMLQDSGFPCFKVGPRTIQNLRKRFQLSLTEEQCVSLVLSLISSSLDAWRTRQYDYYQKVLNGIL